MVRSHEMSSSAKLINLKLNPILHLRLVRAGPRGRDPNDEMVLEAAINGCADALVTYNVKDFDVMAERFNIPVLRPSELLRRVRK
jgi:predicted nucleic acid-binding protein